MKEKISWFSRNILRRLEFWKRMNKIFLSFTILCGNPESERYYKEINRIVFEKYPQSSRILKGNEQNVPKFEDFMQKCGVQEIL